MCSSDLITLYSLPFGLLMILLGALSAADYILILCLSFGISPLLIRMMSLLQLYRKLILPAVKARDTYDLHILKEMCKNKRKR